MAASPHLEWTIIRIGEDMNWWVTEVSDDVHWDVDGLGIVDPRQIGHIMDLCEPLREYGFDADVLDAAFFKFRIDKVLKDGNVHLLRVRESLLDAEDDLFALPDILDEEKGPYADFLDQITKFRVKMLNDLIDFEDNLTIDELEEEIRERQNNDFMEGRAVHFFNEMTAILEYVPEGFELDIEEDERPSVGDEDDLDDIPDIAEEDEKIEEDETMKWDEDEDEDEENEYGEEEQNEEDYSEERPKRGRPRKG